MKAAVLTEIGKDLEILDLDQEGPKQGEVRVRVEATGICMSDWHVMVGDWPTPVPIVPGHEAAGVIEEVGPGVERLKRGDKVIFSFWPNCGACPNCTNGVPTRCTGHNDAAPGAMYDGTRRLRLNGEEISQMARIGTFSEYVICSEEQAIKVDSAMPAGPAALIGCSVATGVGAVIRHAKVQAGSSVAVIGCGGVGLNIVQGARLAGARTIIAVDLLDNKLEMAKAFGATHVINSSKEKLTSAVRDIVKGPGVDYAFDAIGSEQTAAQVVDVVAPGARAVLVGIPAATVRSTISPFQMVYGEKTVSGSFYGSVRPSVDFPILCDFYLKGQLDLDSLISKTIKLDAINAGFQDMRAGAVARSVIQF